MSWAIYNACILVMYTMQHMLCMYRNWYVTHRCSEVCLWHMLHVFEDNILCKNVTLVSDTSMKIIIMIEVRFLFEFCLHSAKNWPILYFYVPSQRKRGFTQCLGAEEQLILFPCPIFLSYWCTQIGKEEQIEGGTCAPPVPYWLCRVKFELYSAVWVFVCEQHDGTRSRLGLSGCTRLVSSCPWHS